MQTTHRMRPRLQGVGGLASAAAHIDSAPVMRHGGKRAGSFLDLEFERLKAEKKEQDKGHINVDLFQGIHAKTISGSVRLHTLHVIGHTLVTVAIVANAVQYGFSVHLNGEPEELWSNFEHAFTAIFLAEVVCKLYVHRMAYFFDPWNIIDFGIVLLSVVGMYVLPMFHIAAKLSTFQVLRLLRLFRLSRLLHVTTHMRLLVENLLYSLQSLGWILGLLLIISFIFSVLCMNLLDQSRYDADEFDAAYYFGDVARAMLTFFNLCILAEWSEVIRPIFDKQPHLVLCLFLPYLMLCTFSVLNLIIGVIAERTMAASAAMKEIEGLREKMKAIIRLTDVIYEGDTDGRLTRQEFLDATAKHPDFIEMMRQCDFPRGFAVEQLHMIFDDAGQGFVEKEEFVNSMFRLIFNNLPQHVITLLLNMAQLKQEVVGQVEQEIGKVHELLELHFGAVQAAELRRDAKQPGCSHRSEASPRQNIKVPMEECSTEAQTPGKNGLLRRPRSVERPLQEMRSTILGLERRMAELLTSMAADQASPSPGLFDQMSPEGSLMHTLDAGQDGMASSQRGIPFPHHTLDKLTPEPTGLGEDIWVQIPDEGPEVLACCASSGAKVALPGQSFNLQVV